MTWRILLSAVVTLGLGAGTLVHEAWPSWYGQEITLQGLIGSKDKRTGRASIDFMARDLRVEGPGIPPFDSPVPAVLVTQRDPVWPAGDDPVQRAQLMVRCVVYVQVERQSEVADPAAAQIAAFSMPVSVSRAPIAGAINLRARVIEAEPTGSFKVALAPPLIPVPAGVEENTFVTVVLRVLPSGRHAIVSLRQ